MIRTEGVVISEMKYGESSKILKVYTKDLGLISIYAKGALKKNSKVTSSSQVFFVNEYSLSKSGSFYYIKSAKIKCSNIHLRNDLKKLTFASVVLEIYLKSSIEGISSKNSYLLLEKYLRILESDSARVRTMQLLLKYVSFLGFRPKTNGMYFLVDGGGMNDTSEHSSHFYKLNKSEVEYLNLLMYKDFSYPFLDCEFEKKMFDIIIEYIKHCLDITTINSLKLIREE